MKKGFTLIEVLATVVILGVLVLIVYPTVNGVIKESREKAYQTQINTIVTEAKKWAADHTDLLNDTSYKLQISELINSGYIQNTENGILEDPRDRSELTGCVLISWNDAYNQYIYEYIEECE